MLPLIVEAYHLAWITASAGMATIAPPVSEWTHSLSGMALDFAPRYVIHHMGDFTTKQSEAGRLLGSVIRNLE